MHFPGFATKKRRAEARLISLLDCYAPFRIKAVVLRLAVGEIAELVGEYLRMTVHQRCYLRQ